MSVSVWPDIYERVSRYVEAHPGADAREITVAVRMMSGLVKTALRRMEQEGFIERRDGHYRSLKPFTRVD